MEGLVKYDSAIQKLQQVPETHIIFADFTDEFLGFIHGSWRWSKHRERLLIHRIYCYAWRHSKGEPVDISIFCYVACTV